MNLIWLLILLAFLSIGCANEVAQAKHRERRQKLHQATRSLDPGLAVRLQSRKCCPDNKNCCSQSDGAFYPCCLVETPGPPMRSALVHDNYHQMLHQQAKAAETKYTLATDDGWAVASTPPKIKLPLLSTLPQTVVDVYVQYDQKKRGAEQSLDDSLPRQNALEYMARELNLGSNAIALQLPTGSAGTASQKLTSASPASQLIGKVVPQLIAKAVYANTIDGYPKLSTASDATSDISDPDSSATDRDGIGGIGTFSTLRKIGCGLPCGPPPCESVCADVIPPDVYFPGLTAIDGLALIPSSPALESAYSDIADDADMRIEAVAASSNN